MRVAFVVQRYGAEVCGGSELLCRHVAERMARQWDVEVLTTCAVDYLTWENVYSPGRTDVGGVPVRRFPVDFPRDPARFGALSTAIFSAAHSEKDERRWMEAQGPYSTAFNRYMAAEHAAYDFVVFFTYLYAFTFFGLPAVPPGKTALVPTAHDEPPIHLGIFRDVFRRPRLLFFNTPEEQEFVNRTFGTGAVLQDVAGMGIDDPPAPSGERFRARHRDVLGDADFLLYAGRIDVSKGCRELLDHFIRFRAEMPDRPLKLVLIGTPAMEIPAHTDVAYLGFVSDQEKFDAIAAARLVMLPSPFESLSIVALEAWALDKPVLANGACAVLRGQCIRANGGLWYESYAEFRGALALLLEAPGFAERLGSSGRAFVERFHDWNVVEAKYRARIEQALGAAAPHPEV